MNYYSRNHWKGLIQYHIIFVCKYRRKLFSNDNFRMFMKQVMQNISAKYDFSLQVQEIDSSKPDHWHGMILSNPALSPSQIVRVLKQESTILAWQHYSSYLKHFYWKEHNLWTRGYFCATIGNASNETVQKYIESQG